jgi:hypothetical protein
MLLVTVLLWGAITRQQIYESLLAGKALNSDRMLVHMSETCALKVDGESYPVIDIQELVKGATTPRGVNHIVVLNPALRVVRTIEYTRERPLFCQDNRLYVWGDLMIENREPAGNVLTFSNHARNVSLSHVEANDVPVPPTKSRKGPPQ